MLLPFPYPITEIIPRRFSCRVYQKIPLAPEEVSQLEAALAAVHAGPLGSALRFELALALEHDPQALHGLGTYGLIKDPAGFIIGAMGPGKNNLEDFGYGLETILLYATGLGIDSCWLGGNFTKSSFSSRMRLGRGETVPAVASIGYAVDEIRARDPLRQKVKSDTRLGWEKLFFAADFETPLSQAEAGAFAVALEMLRLAPSGHNYQPWRVIRDGSCFHFYLQRTPGYGPGSPMFLLLGVSDLQRMEIGIAMCHFDLAISEAGLAGNWQVTKPAVHPPDRAYEYVVTWTAE